MRRVSGNDITLGHLAGVNATLGFPRTARDKHLYICGGTGTGKSKLLEHLIRQDIIAWRKSKCGMLVLDPHGLLYDSLIHWLAWHNIERPIVPIDLRTDDWIVSYNLLRQRQSADPSVLVDNITDAMAYVWGQDGTDETPLFARWAGNVVRALYEKKLTLVEAEHLINRVSKRMRQTLTGDLADQQARQDWQYVDTLTPKEFDAQIGSTINRLQRFIRNQTMRTMFGQPDVSLDFGAALEEGAIILVNLATERARVSKENADLFATLLLSDLWTAAQERGKRKDVKPFYLYLDEFQRFVTPTIAENLDEARGFGLHLTTAHQFPNQLLDRGPNGRRVYNSIMENASSKIVFRLSHEENLRAMAQWLFMGVLNPDEIKHELFSTKVMEYREEMRLVETTGRASGRSRGLQSGNAGGSGRGSTGFSEGEGSSSWTEFTSESQSASDGYSESETHSTSRVPMLMPVMGRELSHVQFRSLDEQLFCSMALLFDQKERHSVARIVGMSAPVSLVTPTIHAVPTSTARAAQYVVRCYEKLPFVLPGDRARRTLTERADKLSQSFLALDDAPVSAKRRIR
jgi:hypothetical protein